ncbi:unnamed protein product [Amoebophrya sp. A120]|nr:unnamed protein product [Amoebophrya sp. A120]|eukprot:GSA120T00007304001.1
MMCMPRIFDTRMNARPRAQQGESERSEDEEEQREDLTAAIAPRASSEKISRLPVALPLVLLSKQKEKATKTSAWCCNIHQRRCGPCNGGTRSIFKRSYEKCSDMIVVSSSCSSLCVRGLLARPLFTLSSRWWWWSKGKAGGNKPELVLLTKKFVSGKDNQERQAGNNPQVEPQRIHARTRSEDDARTQEVAGSPRVLMCGASASEDGHEHDSQGHSGHDHNNHDLPTRAEMMTTGLTGATTKKTKTFWRKKKKKNGKKRGIEMKDLDRAASPSQLPEVEPVSSSAVQDQKENYVVEVNDLKEEQKKLPAGTGTGKKNTTADLILGDEGIKSTQEVMLMDRLAVDVSDHTAPAASPSSQDEPGTTACSGSSTYFSSAETTTTPSSRTTTPAALQVVASPLLDVGDSCSIHSQSFCTSKSNRRRKNKKAGTNGKTTTGNNKTCAHLRVKRSSCSGLTVMMKNINFYKEKIEKTVKNTVKMPMRFWLLQKFVCTPTICPTLVALATPPSPGQEGPARTPGLPFLISFRGPEKGGEE